MAQSSPKLHSRTQSQTLNWIDGITYYYWTQRICNWLDSLEVAQYVLVGAVVSLTPSMRCGTTHEANSCKLPIESCLRVESMSIFSRRELTEHTYQRMLCCYDSEPTLFHSLLIPRLVAGTTFEAIKSSSPGQVNVAHGCDDKCEHESEMVFEAKDEVSAPSPFQRFRSARKSMLLSLDCLFTSSGAMFRNLSIIAKSPRDLVARYFSGFRGILN